MNLLLALALALALVTNPVATSRAATLSAPQIEKLTRDGKVDDAMSKGRAAVGAHPNDVSLRLALARALAAKARRVSRVVDVKLSQDDLDRGQIRVPEVDKNDLPRHVEYDRVLFEEANLHLDEAIKRAATREDLRILKCFLLMDAGHIDRARAAIASALAALPKTPALAKTMIAFGAERTKRSDPAGGVALLTPVASAFPKDAAVQIDYANVLTRLGRKTEAFAAFDRATAIAPQDVHYARTAAVGALLLRDYPRARTAFDVAFRLGQDIEDRFASYAAAYGVDPKASSALMLELGTPAPPEKPSIADLANAFVRAGTMGPGSADAMILARNLVASQQFVFAIPVLDRAIQADPGNAEAKTMLASAYRDLGCAPLAE